MPTEKQIQLEIAHILFMDVVGYSKLSVEAQHAAVEELNSVVRSLDQVQQAETANRLLKIPTGDGMALVFYSSPEVPAQCAVEISRAIKNNSRLQLRMGVHSGPVSGLVDVNERPNLAGAGINIAQRVMDCGDSGHVLVSKRVAEDLEQYDRWRPLLHDLGTCEVKHGVRINIANVYDTEFGNPQLPSKLRAAMRRTRLRWAKGAIAVLAVAGIATGILLKSKILGPAIIQKSIAVLPFENRTEEKTNAYFADAIQDEILSRLSKIADLKVISRTSTLHYKSAPENLPDIARQLGVAHILEGSVQKVGDVVRVNVQLIKAANDSQLWADTLNRKLTDILSVESEVAKAIADHLSAKLTGQEEQAIANKPTDNPEAYDAYLRGLVYTLKPVNTADNVRGAQKYFREGVRLDPKFALCWAALSFVDSRAYSTQSLPPDDSLREEARTSAETALKLQPKLGEALHAQGYYYYAVLKDYDSGVSYFEQARQFLPNDSRIPESLAYVARRRGQWDKSETYFEQAEQLDPRNVGLLFQRGTNYVCLRRFPEALRRFDQVLNITPDDVDIIVEKATIAQAEGDLGRASALLGPLNPPVEDTYPVYAQVYQAALQRHPEQGIPRLKEMLAKSDPGQRSFNGERRFLLGWLQQLAGDKRGAQQTWTQGRIDLESVVAEQPENDGPLGLLALTNMGLGNKAEALTFAERAMLANPSEKDAMLGPGNLDTFARVAAGVGETDRAVAALDKLLSTPYGGNVSGCPLTPTLLRLDPMFDPLRNDPRFKKLIARPLH